jgi:hexosaminidase
MKSFPAQWLLLLGGVFVCAFARTQDLIPHPRYIEIEPHVQRISKGIVLDAALDPVFREYIVIELRKRGVEVVAKGAKLKFVKPQDSLELLEPEAYRIEIGFKGMDITSHTAEGHFRAFQTFLQLIDQRPETDYLGGVFIEDNPKHSWRGLHLDCSRHFFSIDEVKRFLDLMAYYKLNTFHWHLTDDQGWRIEIKKYPLLTQIGAFRDSTLIGHFGEIPERYDHIRTGGFYTQEQVREIVSYAAQRFITVIPEIEMPGHSRAALAAYPQYSCTQQQLPVAGTWGVFDDIFCSKPQTIAFLKDVLDEVMPLFPAPYIHIGGDEAPKLRWESCPLCEVTMKQHGLENAHALQSYFIREIEQHVLVHGKKIIGWDEILEGGLAPQAAVMSWRGTEGGIEAAMQRHPVVMTPMSHCYFDYYQSGRKGEPLAIGGFLPLEKVYAFDAIPEGLPADYEKYILGGQANTWTEYIPDFNQLTYMIYPRAIALAQVLWCTEKPAYGDFCRSLERAHFPYLRKQGITFSYALFEAKPVFKRPESGDAALEIDFKTALETVRVEVKQEDGQRLTMQGDPLCIAPVKKGTQIHQLAYTTSFPGKDPADGWDTIVLEVTPTTGADIWLVTRPHEKFNVGGNVTLVDGIRGARPWKGDQWLGYAEDTVEVVMDLGKDQKIRSAELGFLHDPGSWIHQPDHVLVSVSKDGVKYGKARSFRVLEARSLFRLRAKGRFVRLEVIPMPAIPAGLSGAGNIPWTFIDEIVVR